MMVFFFEFVFAPQKKKINSHCNNNSNSIELVFIISSDSLCDIQKRKLVRFISSELPQNARLFQHCINVI